MRWLGSAGLEGVQAPFPGAAAADAMVLEKEGVKTDQSGSEEGLESGRAALRKVLIGLSDTAGLDGFGEGAIREG